MSDSWIIEHAADLITVRFSEPFHLTDVDTVAQTLESEGYLTENRLFDFRSLETLSPTTTELLDIARRSAAWQIDESLKIAWLAATQVGAGLLRIVTSKFDERTMKVFVSDSEARRWLSSSKTVTQDSPGLVDHFPVRLRGDLSLEQVLQTQRQIRAAEEYRPETPLLWDLRESQLRESLAEVQELAAHIAEVHNQDRAGCKSAILVDSHLMDLIIREMAKHSDWPKDDVVVFRSYRDAVAWLA